MTTCIGRYIALGTSSWRRFKFQFSDIPGRIFREWRDEQGRVVCVDNGAVRLRDPGPPFPAGSLSVPLREAARHEVVQVRLHGRQLVRRESHFELQILLSG